jgi:hypothetical protein
MRAPSRERYLMDGFFGKCAGTGHRRSRTQVSTPRVRPACLPGRGFVYTRCGTRAGDAPRVGKYRLSALTELVEQRSRAMQQGSSSAGVLSTTAVAEPGSGAGIGRDRSSAGEPAAQAVRIDAPAAVMPPKMTSTFLRLIPFILASVPFAHPGGAS